MFTGIIAAAEKVAQIEEKNGNKVFTVEAPERWAFEMGESINVNGVCSTVIAFDDHSFTVEYMPETLRLTTMEDRQVHDLVNLEKSATMETALSGHLVYGHVDDTATVKSITPDGEGSYMVTISHDSQHDKYLIQKGSITLNGISLTAVNPIEGEFSVAIIPHTWMQTNMHTWKEGDSINIEYDMLAKYIAKMLPQNS